MRSFLTKVAGACRQASLSRRGLFQGLAGFAAARIFSSAFWGRQPRRSGPALRLYALALRAAGAASISLALGLAGLTVFIPAYRRLGDASTPLKIAAFCFGSAFAALFARLAGGSYSEAAVASAPEDPSAILAGSGARDALSLGADIFDSAAAGNLAAMALAPPAATPARRRSWLRSCCFPPICSGLPS